MYIHINVRRIVMRMMSIASGSSGNCIYIGTETTHILIDDGISRKRVIEGLTMLDIKAEDIDALLPKVEMLRDITKRICEVKIKEYGEME